MERLALEAQQQKLNISDSSSSGPHHDIDSKKVEKPRPKKVTKSANTSLNSSAEEKKSVKKKGQKLYCICRTPYDKAK